MKKVLSRIGEELLWFIQDLGQLPEVLSSVPYKRMRSKPSRASYYRNLKSLQQQYLVKKVRKGPKQVYILTDKAKVLLSQPKNAKKRTDNLSTLIMFDIPESKNRQRTIFRRYLVRNGFMQYQRSVFIGPLMITNESKVLMQELGIRPFVRVFSGKVDYI